MEFINCGRHCDAAFCHQQDFLPFKCDCCQRTFCLDHRTYSSHACGGAALKDHRSASCASCSASVHYVGGPAEEKLALEAHRMSAGCAQDPRSSIVPTRPRCIAPGCRARPTFSMRVECGSCGGATCMAHRHVDDHACVAAAGVGRSSVSQLRQAFLSRVDGVTAPVVRGKGAGAAALTAPISSCGAESRQVTASLAKEAGVGAGAAPEQCPFCSSRFDDVSALIAHVEGGSHASRRRTVEAVQ